MEIAEDLAYSRKVWVFERIGWCLLALLLTAALAGLFGGGPFSRADVRAKSGWWLEYDRFARRVSPTKLELYLPADSLGNEVRVWVDRTYLDACQIREICPEPQETLLDSGGLVYVFSSQAEHDLAQIVFHLEPQQFGFFTGRVGIGDEPPLAFDQFVYP
jgi:hypothetical protein